MKRIFIILILIVSLFITGCSDDSGGNDQLILSNLNTIDAKTIEAEFSNGKKVEITEFTPSPLEQGENSVEFVYNEVSYSGEVIYGESLFTGNVTMGVTTALNTSIFSNVALAADGSTTADDVSIMAVDQSGNVYSTDTNSNGDFELTTTPDKPYKIIFMNSAGQYIGILKENGKTIEITPGSGKINLADINVDEVAQTANSDNITNLDNVSSVSSIEEPNDLTYDSDLESINAMLFLPSSKNMLEIDTYDQRIILGKIDYSTELSKAIFVEATFEYTTDTPSIASDFALKRIDYFYYKNNSKYLWKYEENDKLYTPDDVVMPALMKRDKQYSASAYSKDGSSVEFTYELKEISTSNQLPDGTSISTEVMVLKLFLPDGTLKGYRYFAKGIGFVGYENVGKDFQSVTFERSGDNKFGAKPSWFDNTLEDDLRTKINNNLNL